MARPIYAAFLRLFPRLFSRKANKDFMGKLREAFQKKQWSLLVRPFPAFSSCLPLSFVFLLLLFLMYALPCGGEETKEGR